LETSLIGEIELTIALHYVFNTPDDLLIWDVGHPNVWTRNTNRSQKTFDTNRQLNGISGSKERK
jgi:1-deoxy-D-xylulose-5-phosphate synthase